MSKYEKEGLTGLLIGITVGIQVLAFMVATLNYRDGCGPYDRLIQFSPGYVIGCELIRKREW